MKRLCLIQDSKKSHTALNSKPGKRVVRRSGPKCSRGGSSIRSAITIVNSDIWSGDDRVNRSGALRKLIAKGPPSTAPTGTAVRRSNTPDGAATATMKKSCARQEPMIRRWKRSWVSLSTKPTRQPGHGLPGTGTTPGLHGTDLRSGGHRDSHGGIHISDSSEVPGRREWDPVSCQDYLCPRQPVLPTGVPLRGVTGVSVDSESANP